MHRTAGESLGLRHPPSLMSKAKLLTLSFQIVPLKSKQLLEQLKRRELDRGCAKLRRSFALSNQDTTCECCLSDRAGGELPLHHF